MSARTIALPFYAGLTAKDVDLVVQEVDLMISRENLVPRN